MTTVACVVIASAKRLQLLDDLIMPSVTAQCFDEIVVVGDYHSGEGWRHLPFRPVFGNTIDALWKRDVGTVATSSDYIVYLCDDHRLHPDFSKDLAKVLSENPKNVFAPARFCIRNKKHIGLNMGFHADPDRAYIGGHCGIFPRSAIQQVPWGISPLHANWDYLHSRALLGHGFILCFFHDACFIEDIEGGTPWL
jgi:hypothetical protein